MVSQCKAITLHHLKDIIINIIKWWSGIIILQLIAKINIIVLLQWHKINISGMCVSNHTAIWSFWISNRNSTHRIIQYSISVTRAQILSQLNVITVMVINTNTLFTILFWITFHSIRNGVNWVRFCKTMVTSLQKHNN